MALIRKFYPLEFSHEISNPSTGFSNTLFQRRVENRGENEMISIGDPISFRGFAVNRNASAHRVDSHSIPPFYQRKPAPVII